MADRIGRPMTSGIRALIDEALYLAMNGGSGGGGGSLLAGDVIAPDTNNRVVQLRGRVADKIVAQQDGVAIDLANGTSVRQGGIVYVRPIGGGADDWPTLMNVIAPAAAYKYAIALLPGTAGEAFQAKSPQVIPNGTTFLGTPGTVVQQTLSTVGPQSLAAFVCGATMANATTLNGGVAKGSVTVTVNAAIAPGTEIGLISSVGAFLQEYRTVVSVSGGGGLTLHLDRPLYYDYNNGDTVQTGTLPRDIRILGNGMRVTGSGVRLVEMATAQNCEVSDLVLDGATGTIGQVMSWDVGSYNCVSRRVRVAAGGSNTHGLMLESAEQCIYDDCDVVEADQAQTVTAAFLLFDCNGCTIRDCYASGVSDGVLVTDDGSGLGSFDTFIDGGEFDKCHSGILVAPPSARTRIVGARCEFSTLAGINEQGTGTNIQDVSCVNGSQAVTTTGIAIQSTSKDCSVNGADVSGNVVGLQALASCALSDIESLSGNANTTFVLGDGAHAAFITLRGFTARAAAGLVVNALALVEMRDGLVAPAAGNTGVFVLGGVCRMSCVRVDGAAGGNTGVNVFAGATWRNQTGNDFDSCATPVTLAGGSFSSNGTVQANGVTPVAVSWPDLKATDRVWLVLNTPNLAGGIDTQNPKVARTPGTGFTVTSVANDTSVYDYIVGNG